MVYDFAMQQEDSMTIIQCAWVFDPTLKEAGIGLREGPYIIQIFLDFY
jgi:hypothetical protein